MIHQSPAATAAKIMNAGSSRSAVKKSGVTKNGVNRKKGAKKSAKRKSAAKKSAVRKNADKRRKGVVRLLNAANPTGARRPEDS